MKPPTLRLPTVSLVTTSRYFPSSEKKNLQFEDIV